MNIIRISIRIAIPASLHPNLVGIQNREVHIVERPITPETRGIAVRPLLQLVVVADVCDCCQSVSRS